MALSGDRTAVRCRKERSMKGIAFSGWLVALVCGAACGCVAQAPDVAQAPTPQASDPQPLNQPVKSTMTCEELTALIKAGDKRTGGAAILWLDGFYSGRSGLTELPAGWTRTVAQGIGGTCAISVNARRTVLDVIGQLHREYGS
jgi:hypothetical protein